MHDLMQALRTRSHDDVIGWDEQRQQQVTHAAFVHEVQRWRHVLCRINGANIALYLSDSLSFAAALLAAWAERKTVWLNADTLPANCALMHVSVDAFVGEFPAEFAPIELAADTAIDAPLIKTDTLFSPLPDDFIALMVHTSGSTGAAQAIPKQWRQLASELQTLESTFGARVGSGSKSAAVLATVSHQHIYGLLFKVLWPLACGRVIHAQSLNFPEQMLHAFLRGECVLVASPAHLKRLPDHLDWRSARQYVRMVFCSGGPLPPDAALRVGELLGQIPVEVYGSSETGGIAWRQRRADVVDAMSCIDVAVADELTHQWQAFASVQIRESKDVLEVASPHLPDAEWFPLADRVQMCGERFFTLLGRVDRIVKIEEKRISLDVIECALLASALVSEVRIVLESEADELSQHARQRLTAFVVLSDSGQERLTTEGKNAVNQVLRATLVGVVEAIAIPRRWRYLDQLPVNAQGKTTQAQLLALFDERSRLPQLRVVEQSEQMVCYELIAPASLLYFDGHFTQAPVLPGVVQIDWAIQFARERFALPPYFSAVHALKFQNIIFPDTPVMLELKHDAIKASVQFRYFSAAGQHATGRILFTSSFD